jgi:hypothetical protein
MTQERYFWCFLAGHLPAFRSSASHYLTLELEKQESFIHDGNALKFTSDDYYFRDANLPSHSKNSGIPTS